MIPKRRIKKMSPSKRILVICWLLFLLAIMTAGVHANDGKPARIAAKNDVPINYYQAFMIVVAAGYGIYLLIRARRKKRNEQL